MRPKALRVPAHLTQYTDLAEQDAQCLPGLLVAVVMTLDSQLCPVATIH